MSVELIDVAIEIQRERLIDPHRREIHDCTIVEQQSEGLREEARRLDFCPLPERWCD
jgi:hypothetical protein